ncbi:MAG: hypothetical protein VW875_10850 [Planctomycetaceae bacterium]
MTDHNVHLNSLRIIQARGISRESQFEINDLGNVNVIFGRNGIGKSTVGLAIYKLLRPNDLLLDKTAEVAGQLQMGERELDLRVAMSQGQAVENGTLTEYPEFRSAGELSRYRLALEALIKEDDVEFAKVIADEMRGGIDLRAVAKKIGSNEKPKRPSKLESEWKNLNRDEKSLRQEQASLARQSQQLTVWEEEQQELYATLELQPALLAYQEASALRKQLEEFDQQLKEYPGTLANLKGGESEELKSLQAQMENAKHDLVNCRTLEAEAKAVVDSLADLPDATALKLRQLEELQAEFAELQKEIRSKENECTRIEGKIVSLVSEFANVDSVAQMEQQIAEIDLTEVDTTYHQVVMSRQRLREAQGSYDYLEVDASEEPVSRDELARRLQGLQAWCGAADQERHQFGILTGRLVVVGSYLMACWATGLAISYTPLWLLALVVPVILCVLALRAKPRSEQNRPTRQEIESSEGHLYPELTEWSPLTVRQLMDDLLEQDSQAALAEKRYHYFKATEQKLHQAQQEFKLANEKLSELSSGLGLKNNGLDSEAKLLKLVNAIAQWEIEKAELAGAESSLAALRNTSTVLQKRLIDGLPDFGLNVTESTSMFRAEVREAASLLEALEVAKVAVIDRERDGKHASEIASQRERQLDGFLSRLDAHGKTVADLEALERVLPEYTSRVEGRFRADTILKEKEAELAARPEVKGFSSDEVRDLLLICEGAQERIQTLTRTIQDSRTKMDSLQQGTLLADAMSAKAEKADELRNDYHRALESLAGFCLVEHLLHETEGNNSSSVLDQAAITLHRITGGKLKLDVYPGNAVEQFVISDAIGVRRDLDSLSVGERVQVLLAVRLAFLSIEETAALPIVVDEALGTADDDRAHEIIESLVKLAKEGRQVFYFTAQTDEVEKWKAVLGRQEGIAGTFVDLDQLRGLEPNVTPEQSEAFVRQNIVPPPEKCTHAEYGERLGASLPSAGMFREDSLSVWAVLDDVNDVYKCWQRRVRTVGMLSDNSRLGQQMSLAPEVVKAAIVRAKALAAALEEYWAGRALPLEMVDLIESDAFTDRWLEPVWNLATQVDCDGAQLIQALKAGGVKRFRQDDIVALEASLRERGKIVESDVSTPDQVEAAAVAVFEQEGIDLTGQMEWLLTRLCQMLGDYRDTGERDG